MQECWHENPSVRLSTLRMKKSISALYPYTSTDKGHRSSLESGNQPFGNNPHGSRNFHYNPNGKLMNISRNSSGGATMTGTISSGYQSKASTSTNSSSSTAASSASAMAPFAINHPHHSQPNQQFKFPMNPYQNRILNTSIDENLEETQS